MYYNYKRFVMGSNWAYSIGNWALWEPKTQWVGKRSDPKHKSRFSFYNPRWFFLSRL